VDLMYVCMVVEEGGGAPEYLCTPISKKVSNLLCTGEMDLREVFRNPEINSFYKCVFSESECLFIGVRHDFESCPEKWLPDEGLFFHDYDEVASKALELNSTISYASLSVHEAKGVPRIKSVKLSEFLTVYQNAIKYLYKLSAKESKKVISKGDTPYSTDVFGFSYGSFTVQMQSSHKGDLLGDNALLAASFDKLNKFLNLTADEEKAIAYLRSIKGHSAGSLIKLLEFMVEHSCPLRHRWATPDMGESSSSYVDVSAISELVKICRQREDLIGEEVVVEGFFTKADSVTNTWKLIGQDNQPLSGGVDENSFVTMDGVVINRQRYRLECEEHVEMVLGTSKEIKKLLIKRLEKIS